MNVPALILRCYGRQVWWYWVEAENNAARFGGSRKFETFWATSEWSNAMRSVTYSLPDVCCLAEFLKLQGEEWRCYFGCLMKLPYMIFIKDERELRIVHW